MYIMVVYVFIFGCVFFKGLKFDVVLIDSIVLYFRIINILRIVVDIKFFDGFVFFIVL